MDSLFANRPLSGHFCCHGNHTGGQTKKAGQTVSNQSDQTLCTIAGGGTV